MHTPRYVFPRPCAYRPVLPPVCGHAPQVALQPSQPTETDGLLVPPELQPAVLQRAIRAKGASGALSGALDLGGTCGEMLLEDGGGA